MSLLLLVSSLRGLPPRARRRRLRGLLPCAPDGPFDLLERLALVEGKQRPERIALSLRQLFAPGVGQCFHVGGTDLVGRTEGSSVLRTAEEHGAQCGGVDIAGAIPPGPGMVVGRSQDTPRFGIGFADGPLVLEGGLLARLRAVTHIWPSE